MYNRTPGPVIQLLGSLGMFMSNEIYSPPSAKLGDEKPQRKENAALKICLWVVGSIAALAYFVSMLFVIAYFAGIVTPPPDFTIPNELIISHRILLGFLVPFSFVQLVMRKRSSAYLYALCAVLTLFVHIVLKLSFSAAMAIQGPGVFAIAILVVLALLSWVFTKSVGAGET